MPFNHLFLCHPLLLPSSIFPASGSFPMSQFFASGGQSIGVSATASVLPTSIFPASGSFPMSQFFASGGQSIGVSASASVLPMSTQA